MSDITIHITRYINSLREAWMRIDAEAAQAITDCRLRPIDYSFYQTWEWNSAVDAYYRKQRPLFKHVDYLVMSRDGETIGILPLLVTAFPKKKVEFTSWKTAGINNVSSALTEADDFVPLARFIKGKYHGNKLMLNDMPLGVPFVAAMARELGVEPKERKSYHIPLGDFEDFDQYYASLSKKLRHNVQTRSNHFTHGDLHWELREFSSLKPPTRDYWLKIWRIFYSRKLQWKGKHANPLRRLGCEFEARRELRSGLRTASFGDLNESRLFVFEINGEPAAFTLLYLRDGRIVVPKLAVDMRFRTHAPGILMLKALLARCYSAGVTDFDLCRGEEPYKEQMGALNQPICGIKTRL